jgi:hypothetical protein
VQQCTGATRLVPAGEATGVMPLVLASAAICGPSSVPAAWTWPVISASCRDTVSAKSMIVRVSAYGSPCCQ